MPTPCICSFCPQRRRAGVIMAGRLVFEMWCVCVWWSWLLIWNFSSSLSRKTLHTAALRSVDGHCHCWLPFWKMELKCCMTHLSLCLGSGQPITYTVVSRLHLQWRGVDRGTWVLVCGCCVHPAAQELSLSTGKDFLCLPVPHSGSWHRQVSWSDTGPGHA